jgi:SAM-dependent methyltransferase
MDERQITTRTTKIAEPSAPCWTSKNLIHRLEIIGGKDNFPADRETAEKTISVFPSIAVAARANRDFMVRAAQFLAGEVKVAQFLDVGTGIPTSPNLHEVVQTINPAARVIYTDNDPLVLAHARALLTSHPLGRTAYLEADLRDPERILAALAPRDTIDLSQPVALFLVAVLHFLPPDADPHGIVRRLLDALPAGSYLVFSHATADANTAVDEAAAGYRERGVPFHPRPRAEVARFADGLELLEPGLVMVDRWRQPDPGDEHEPEQVSCYGAVARTFG